MPRMWDAAFPPFPTGFDAAAGYVGGNTPHIWTDAEWARAAQVSPFLLPIFVRSFGGVPANDAQVMLDWLAAHKVPKGVVTALDLETRVDPVYVKAYDFKIVSGGYLTVIYGSRNYVLQNPKTSGGYWTATWNNIPHLDPGAVITQYGGDTHGEPFDLNVVAASVNLWKAGDMSQFGPQNWDTNDKTAFRDVQREVLSNWLFGNRLSTMGVGNVFDLAPEFVASSNLAKGFARAVVAALPQGSTDLTAEDITLAVLEAFRRGTG